MTFDIILDSHLINCPLCKKSIDAITCGFVECSYAFKGIKVVDGDRIPVSSNGYTYVGNVYRQFSPAVLDSAMWKSIMLIIKYDAPRNTDAQLVMCCLCKKYDKSNGNIIKILNSDLLCHNECSELVMKALSGICYSF